MKTKVARRGVRLSDLRNPQLLAERLEALAAHHNVWLQAAGQPAVNAADMASYLMEMAEELLSFAGRSWQVLAAARDARQTILFEGAQGVMLDIDHGTYPFVTSSNTVAGQAATGAGTGPSSVEFTLGITKAYTTRVGSGPFQPNISARMASGWASAAANWHCHRAQAALWLV